MVSPVSSSLSHTFASTDNGLFLVHRIHCFENVTAVLFLAAVSGYDVSPLLPTSAAIFAGTDHAILRFVSLSQQVLLEDPDSVRGKISQCPISF